VHVRYFSHQTKPRSWIFFLCNSREHGFSSCQEPVNQGGDWSGLKEFQKSQTNLGVIASVAGSGESPGIAGDLFSISGIKNKREHGETLSCVYITPWLELTCAEAA